MRSASRAHVASVRRRWAAASADSLAGASAFPPIATTSFFIRRLPEEVPRYFDERIRTLGLGTRRREPPPPEVAAELFIKKAASDGFVASEETFALRL